MAERGDKLQEDFQSLTTWTLQEEAPAAPDSVGSVWNRRVVNMRRA